MTDEIKTLYEYNGVYYDRLEDAKEQKKRDTVSKDKEDIQSKFAKFRYYVFRDSSEVDNVVYTTYHIPKTVVDDTMQMVVVHREYDKNFRTYIVHCRTQDMTLEQFNEMFIHSTALTSSHIKQSRDSAIRNYIGLELTNTIIRALE